jgi:hypothetical protein
MNLDIAQGYGPSSVIGAPKQVVCLRCVCNHAYQNSPFTRIVEFELLPLNCNETLTAPDALNPLANPPTDPAFGALTFDHATNKITIDTPIPFLYNATNVDQSPNGVLTLGYKNLFKYTEVSGCEIVCTFGHTCGIGSSLGGTPATEGSFNNNINFATNDTTAGKNQELFIANGNLDQLASPFITAVYDIAYRETFCIHCTAPNFMEITYNVEVT